MKVLISQLRQMHSGSGSFPIFIPGLFLENGIWCVDVVPNLSPGRHLLKTAAWILHMFELCFLVEYSTCAPATKSLFGHSIILQFQFQVCPTWYPSMNVYFGSCIHVSPSEVNFSQLHVMALLIHVYFAKEFATTTTPS